MSETQSHLVVSLSFKLFEDLLKYTDTSMTEYQLRLYITGWLLDNGVRLVKDEDNDKPFRGEI